jgi:NADPH:quinone reductase
MRCLVIKSFGEPKDVLALEEQPAPEPGPGQVRLRMIQSPIHNHDLAIIRGVYGSRPPLPAIPGTEAVGVVDSTGPGVSEALVGQRACAAGVQGTWAEYFLTRASAIVPVPAAVPDEVACQVLGMPLSACILIEDFGLQPGQWMIQNAASGAVARVVNALARERGFQVINLVRRKDSQAQLEADGVEHVLSTDDPHWTKAAIQMTGGAPIVRAVDSVGGRAANDLMKTLGPDGLLMSFGALSGEPLIIDPGHLIFKQTVVKGFWATRRSEQISPADRGRMVGEVLRLAVAGRLGLRVEARFDLSRAAQAVVASEKPGRTGKVVVYPGA